ncbi:MAG: aminotransferase class I/II-fold pyridoxal phosphate-dependent enzyme [Rhodospirillales bacterium]|nr:aminotransferase class I/II-fold pyridoxal phosphate-dependent enzyme [Rhodospirillales bacterium]
MNINPRLTTLPDFPFDKLKTLLEGITPPEELDPIALSVGEPQQPVPHWVRDIVSDNFHTWNKYPPFPGSVDLRQAIAGWLGRRFGLGHGDIDPMVHILACAGTREALYLLPTWLVPDQKNGKRPIVAMPNPFYHVYGTAALASGAESLYLSATKETGYLPDLDELDAEILSRLSILFLCSPANPQGAVADHTYLERAINLARKYDFTLCVDECYADVYDTTPPLSALQVCRDMDGSGTDYTNVLVFHSLSKRSNGAGLRSGFFAGDAAIMQGYGRFRSYISASIPLPIDAASAAVWSEDSHTDDIRAFYRNNFDIAERIIDGRFDFYRPDGGFFLWLNTGNGEQAAQTLWRDAGVRVLPGAHSAREDKNGFNPGASHIRLALVNDAPVISEACERLVKVL